MKVLILNSGLGSRMGALTVGKPKCLTPIGNDYTILSWQLELLYRLGIKDIVITTGPYESQLKVHAFENRHDFNISFVSNPIYNKTNYIYSMFLARDELRGDDIIIMHGDLVIELSVLKELLETEGSAITVDSTLPLPEKDFKAVMCDGLVKSVGVEFMNEQSIACQPLYKFSSEDFALYMDKICEFCDDDNVNCYAENALNLLTDKIRIAPFELRGRLCNEIDNLDDLEMVAARFVRIGE